MWNYDRQMHSFQALAETLRLELAYALNLELGRIGDVNVFDAADADAVVTSVDSNSYYAEIAAAAAAARSEACAAGGGNGDCSDDEVRSEE